VVNQFVVALLSIALFDVENANLMVGPYYLEGGETAFDWVPKPILFIMMVQKPLRTAE